MNVYYRWLENGSHACLSPWDVMVDRPRSTNYHLSRPCLDDDEKKRARNALKKLKCIPCVREQLQFPVNQRQYSDYSFRVEVPMHLGLVERRLDANYYSNRMSIVADIKLIRDNVVKYNGEAGLLQDGARKMYEEFEREMLNEEERRQYNDLKVTTATSAARETMRSSLENLPSPASNRYDTEPGASSDRRSSLRIRISTSQVPAQQPAQMLVVRALRSNAGPPPNEPAPSASFANAAARGMAPRRTRRASNDNSGDAALSNGARGIDRSAQNETTQPEIASGTRRSSRARRARTPLEDHDEMAQPGVASAMRRSSRMRAPPDGESHEDADSMLESPAANSRTRSRGVSSSHFPLDEHSSDIETAGDTKPAARSTRNSQRTSQAPERGSDHISNHRATQQASRADRAAKRNATDEDPVQELEPESEHKAPSNPRKRHAAALDKSAESEAEEELSETSEREAEEEEEEAEEMQSDSDESELSSPERRASARSSARKSSARKPSGGTSNSRPSRVASSKRRSSRRGNNISYADVSESEFEEPEEEVSDSEEETKRRSPQKQAARARGNANHSAKKKPKARSKRKRGKPLAAFRLDVWGAALSHTDDFPSSGEDTDESAEEEDYVVPTPKRARGRKIWHEIDKKHITKVALRILTFLREMDENNVFENPVVEEHPELKIPYSEVVTTPMCFRDIEEENLQRYHSITGR
jgi:Bromodomain